MTIEAIAEIMEEVDFVKMDAEGQEKTIILGTETKHWQNTDMIVEIGQKKMLLLFLITYKRLVCARLLKSSVGQNYIVSDMPSHYTQGSYFLHKNLRCTGGKL